MSQEVIAVGWKSQFATALRLFGHRNWIVVADSAYPAQSRSGIETVAADADQVYVLRTVIEGVSASSHIRANVYLDHELDYLSEQDAPGVANYRRELSTILRDSAVFRQPHEQIIHKLDQSAQLFRILIIKTKFTIPYTSVFLELDCGYWSANAESRLRATIANTEPN